MAYPSTISTFATPTPSDRLNNPSHSALHNAENDAITEIQEFLGTTDSSVVGSLIYDVRSPDSDGGGHVQTPNKGGTGITSFMKGDMLVAQSSSVIVKLAVGPDGQALVSDSGAAAGVKWGTAGIFVSSTISESSIWSRPASVLATSRVLVQLWGGGGSGSQGSGAEEAGGGGGGGYAEGWYFATALPSSVIVNVGKGGDSTTGTGQAGGISVFHVQASLLTAYGGGGGDRSTTGGAGGGGGGVFASGSPAVTSSPGGGGSILGGDGSTSTPPSALYGGGGGGSTNATSAWGGARAFYGGGGGGAVASSVVATSGGQSMRGGSGRGGSVVGAGSSVQAGIIPGGGGGAAFGGSSGEGGRGMLIVTTFI